MNTPGREFGLHTFPPLLGTIRIRSCATSLAQAYHKTQTFRPLAPPVTCKTQQHETRSTLVAILVLAQHFVIAVSQRRIGKTPTGIRTGKVLTSASDKCRTRSGSRNRIEGRESGYWYSSFELGVAYRELNSPHSEPIMRPHRATHQYRLNSNSKPRPRDQMCLNCFKHVVHD
jgi:hypothetical protein